MFPRSGGFITFPVCSLAFILFTCVHGYSDRILYCPPGSSVIVDGESTHISEGGGRIYELADISARGTTFTIDGVVMSNVRGTSYMLANTDLTWSLQTTDKDYGMRGMLVRVETLGVLFTLDGDKPLKVAVPCTGGTTAGVSHSEPSRKVKVTGKMRFDALGTALIDVTVIYRNFFGAGKDNASVTGHTTFYVEIVDKLPPTPPRAPTKAPIKTPAPLCKAPVKVPVKIPINMPAITAKVPVKSPVKVPTTTAKVPVKSPVKLPATPAKVPVKSPVKLPATPAKVPVKSPVKLPLTPAKTPVKVPVKTPARLPVRSVPVRVPVKGSVSTPVKLPLKQRRLDDDEHDHDDEGGVTLPVPTTPVKSPLGTTCSD